MLLIAGFLGAFFMGLTLGLIGGGGSILSVPIFVYLFSIQPSLATAYSLFVVGLSALIGAFGYAKQKLINYQTGFLFAVPSFVGVFAVRKWVMPVIPDQLLQIGQWSLTKNGLIMLVFAVLMLVASASMIRPSKNQTKKSEMSTALRYLIIALEGLVVGGITGFVGAGGGFLIIPALVILTGLPMKEAVGTSLAIIAVKSLFGFLGDLRPEQFIDWNFLWQFSAVAIVGILIGQMLNKKVPEQKLKPAFGYFVLLMGSFILIQQLYKS